MKTDNVVLKINGMSCGGCEQRINDRLRKLEGVQSVASDHRRGEVRILFDAAQTSPVVLQAAISALGYEVRP